jgi:hypothetical protein
MYNEIKYNKNHINGKSSDGVLRHIAELPVDAVLS